MIGRYISVVGLVLMAGCTDLFGDDARPDDRPIAMPQTDPEAVAQEPLQSPENAVKSFVQVIERVEPVAEQVCRTRTRGIDCDLQIFVDRRIDQPPNAFQTVDKAGRPIIVFTVALIADARNADEIAFVLGHEASHHILGHIPRKQDSAQTSAILASVLAQVAGAAPDAVRAAGNIGAEVGARQYSKDFELEADALGTEIAYLANYDPLRGAAFFSRIPDPGDQFLGSHPPNAERQRTVRRTLARLQ